MKQLTNKMGEQIPMIGLGTFPFEGKVMAKMVTDAVNIGYRLFDTADDYRGESGIGMAVIQLQEAGIPRECLFLQTKISDNNAHEDEPLKGIYFNPDNRFMKRHTVDEIVREKVYTSLREMNTSYIDSLLIHYPFPEYIVEIWKTMIALRSEGVVRYIGVSNFHEWHIKELINATGVCPDINEVYVSPIGTKQSIIDYCIRHDCLVMVYSPLMDIAHNRISLNEILPIMEKYGKSAAQVVLRWNIERGGVPLPKTKSSVRLAENFDVFDFSLTPSEVASISALNRDNQFLVESKICPGL